MADAVAELNPADDLRQSITAIELSPFLLRRHHQPEGHGETGLPAEATLGAFRPVSDGGKGALDRIWSNARKLVMP